MKKILSLFFVLFLFFVLGINSVQAGETALSGWAWSSNVGWISFNSSDAGAGGVPYAVKVATTTNSSIGNVSGYAWSPNIGWIKFGGLSDFPSSGANATINFDNGKVEGWARACAGTEDGRCASMNSRSDGWDGWISLSGTNHTSPDTSGTGGISAKGITLGIDKTKPEAFGKLTGFSWGGDVVGWIMFSPIAGISGTGVKVCPDPGLDCGGGGTPAFSLVATDGVEVQKAADSEVYANVRVSGGTSGNQTINVTLGSFTPPSGISVSLRDASGNPTSGTVTCSITPSLPDCWAKVRLFISSVASLADINSITVPVIGTRTSPSLPSNNVISDDAGFILRDSDSEGDKSLWIVEQISAGVFNTTTQYERITIREGMTANLAWNTVGVDEGTCRGINNGPNDSTVLNAWKNAQPESKDSDSPFQISGLVKGEYNLVLSCDVDGDTLNTNSVKIRVIKSTEAEF